MGILLLFSGLVVLIRRSLKSDEDLIKSAFSALALTHRSQSDAPEVAPPSQQLALMASNGLQVAPRLLGHIRSAMMTCQPSAHPRAHHVFCCLWATVCATLLLLACVSLTSADDGKHLAALSHAGIPSTHPRLEPIRRARRPHVLVARQHLKPRHLHRLHAQVDFTHTGVPRLDPVVIDHPRHWSPPATRDARDQSLTC